MKVLFVDTSIDGHHQTYLSGLLENCSEQAYAFIPEDEKFDCKGEYRKVIHPIDWQKKSLRDYLKWIEGIASLAKKINPDIIHILDGDTIMRYFGMGLRKLDSWPVIITYHHFFEGKLRRLSYKMMLNGKNRMAIVHTSEIKRRLKEYDIVNVEHIEYPVFWYKQISNCNPLECKTKLDLPVDIPILGIIGATDRYKGTMVLLESIKYIKNEVCIFFAGKESDIKKEQIELYNTNPKVKIITRLKWLTQNEYIDCLVACDYIVLPYTKEFNGASGPLADGVVANKNIIGSDYGSLGKIITENKLGNVFEVDNSKMLAQLINKATKKSGQKEVEYLNYKEKLKPDNFYEKYKKVYNKFVNN